MNGRRQSTGKLMFILSALIGLPSIGLLVWANSINFDNCFAVGNIEDIACGPWIAAGLASYFGTGGIILSILIALIALPIHFSPDTQ